MAKRQDYSGDFVSSLKTITEEVAILPKLFRRIVDYMGQGGKIDGFKEHLQRCEPLVRIQQVHHQASMQSSMCGDTGEAGRGT